MKDKKFRENIKLYNLVMSNIWQMITTIFFGILLGYLLNRNSEKDGKIYFLVSVLLFVLIAIFNFFRSIIVGLKKISKREELKRILEEKNQNNLENTDDFEEINQNNLENKDDYEEKI